MTRDTRVGIYAAAIAVLFAAVMAYWVAGLQWETLPIGVFVAAVTFVVLRDRVDGWTS